MKDIMLDIETLGNTMNSIVIQVAMIRFDRETGNIGESLAIRLDGKQQEDLGLIHTQDTIDWWKRTNLELFKQLLTENVISVEDGLNQISMFIKPTDLIWCHANFDIPLLCSVYQAANKKTPWGYKNVRDIRTLTDLANLDLRQYNWNAEKTHDALDDCRFQIKYCVDAIKRLK